MKVKLLILKTMFCCKKVKLFYNLSQILLFGETLINIISEKIGADSGNRTRTSCLEGKGTTTMQYPLKLVFKSKVLIERLITVNIPC